MENEGREREREGNKKEGKGKVRKGGKETRCHTGRFFHFYLLPISMAAEH